MIEKTAGDPRVLVAGNTTKEAHALLISRPSADVILYGTLVRECIMVGDPDYRVEAFAMTRTKLASERIIGYFEGISPLGQKPAAERVEPYTYPYQVYLPRYVTYRSFDLSARILMGLQVELGLLFGHSQDIQESFVLSFLPRTHE